VATALVGDDADLAARVAAHRSRRPSWWGTAEVGRELPAVVAALEGTLLVDSLGPWVAASPELEADVIALVAALAGRRGDAVVVSEEVGLGVHPSTEVGRRFRDALGTVNRAVADAADDVLLVVAGRVLRLERP
jgi:adenosylcobinamide kinase/adenosylcobinamide-phosphate guanylyltransferase